MRSLTVEEIERLEHNGCTAADWGNILVAEDFRPDYIRDVAFYGEVRLGVFEKTLEVTEGLHLHSGIRQATTLAKDRKATSKYGTNNDEDSKTIAVLLENIGFISLPPLIFFTILFLTNSATLSLTPTLLKCHANISLTYSG